MCPKYGFQKTKITWGRWGLLFLINKNGIPVGTCLKRKMRGCRHTLGGGGHQIANSIKRHTPLDNYYAFIITIKDCSITNDP